jgi:hypothetical protein
MNIDEQYFQNYETMNQFNNKLLDIQTKFDQKFDELNKRLDNLESKNDILKTRFTNIEKSLTSLEKEIADINRANYIEAYKNLRKGISFPYSHVLSRDFFPHKKINNDEHMD